jgi:hypothetical protein
MAKARLLEADGSFLRIGGEAAARLSPFRIRVG